MLFSRQMYTLLKAGVPILRALAGLQQSANNRVARRGDRRPARQPGRRARAVGGDAQPPARVHPVLRQRDPHRRDHRRARPVIQPHVRVHGVRQGHPRPHQGRGALPDHRAGGDRGGGGDRQLRRDPGVRQDVRVAEGAAAAAHAAADRHVELLPGLLAGDAGRARRLAVLGAQSYLGTEQGRYQWDRWKAAPAACRPIILRATLARFARGMALAIRAGVPIVQAMSVVAEVVRTTLHGAAHPQHARRRRARRDRAAHGHREPASSRPWCWR